MFSLQQHDAWCARPTGDGPALILGTGACAGVVRRSWGLPSLGASANAAWSRVPAVERHHTDPIDVPNGALCYGLFNHEFGHAWVASTGLEAWTTDYVKMGTFRLALMNLPRWTGDSRVWWTSWTQFGRLPVGSTERQRHTTPVPTPPSPTHISIPTEDSMFLASVQYGGNSLSYWLVGHPRGIVGVGSDEATSWTGARIHVNDEATWRRILDRMGPQ